MTAKRMATWIGVVVMAVSAGWASAQPAPIGPTPVRPGYSPYLNLLRGSGGSGPALSYYGLVRPEQDFRRSQQQMQSQLSMLQASQAMTTTTGSVDLVSDLPQTGHGVSFLNTGGYFQNLRTGGGIGAGGVVNRPGAAGGGMMNRGSAAPPPSVRR